MFRILMGKDLQEGTFTSIFATKVWRCSMGSGNRPLGSGSSGRSFDSGDAFGVLFEADCLGLVTVGLGATGGGFLAAATDEYLGVDIAAFREMAAPLPKNCVSLEKLSNLLVVVVSLFMVLLLCTLLVVVVWMELFTFFSDSSRFRARLAASFMISSVLLASPRTALVSISSMLSSVCIVLIVVPFFPFTGGVVPFSRLRLKRAFISRRALPGGERSIPSRIEGKSSSARLDLERVDDAISGERGVERLEIVYGW